MRRRPAAAGVGLHRPAAAVPRRRRVEGGDLGPAEVEQKYQAGEKVRGEKLSPGVLQRGHWLVLEDATYYKDVIQLAGKVIKEELEGGEREVHLSLTGTKSEQLLQFASGQRAAVVRVHLCRDDCPRTRENPDLVHGTSLQKIAEGGEKTWETNLLTEGDVGLLEADHDRWLKEEAEKKKQRRSTSSSKEKRKKKKEKEKEKEGQEGCVSGGETRPISREKKGKDWEQGTCQEDAGGLLQQHRVGSQPQSEASHCSEGQEGSQKSKREHLVDEHIYQHRGVEWRREQSPGRPQQSTPAGCPITRVLTASSVLTMSQFLTQVSGTGWEQEAPGVQPLLSLYNRVYIAGKLSGGMQREFQTLCHCGDLLLQGRLAETLDVVVQRLKSLELVGQGTPWQTAQKLELVPPSEAAIASRQEHQLARKEAKLDMSVKGSASSGAPEKGKGKGKGKNQEKGKDKNKGKAKEADPKKTA